MAKEKEIGYSPDLSLKKDEDVFGDEGSHDIRYKTLSWQVSQTTQARQRIAEVFHLVRQPAHDRGNCQ